MILALRFVHIASAAHNKMASEAESTTEPQHDVTGSLNSDEAVTQTVEVDKKYVGKIIGRGGEMIVTLQETTGARMLIDQNVPDGHQCKVVISGLNQQVEAAVAAVNLIVTEGTSALRLMAAQRQQPQQQGSYRYQNREDNQNPDGYGPPPMQQHPYQPNVPPPPATAKPREDLLERLMRRDLLIDGEVDKTLKCGMCFDIFHVPINCAGGHSWCRHCVKGRLGRTRP